MSTTPTPLHREVTHARLVIVGSGPAGYTAAIYAARAMVEPLLISGFQPGGQLMITTDVENYPGFAEAIQGPWLMEQMRLQAEHVGTRIVSEYIARVDLKQRPFRLEADSGAVYTCDALVIATGAQAKWLGLPSEAAFQGFGVSACATCDGFFFRGKEVVVVGGGNSAVEEALYLANLASKVTVVHRRDAFRAERILQERLFKHPNVEVVWNHAVEEICGRTAPTPSVTHLRLRDTRTGALTERRTDGVFVAIGHQPATGLFEGQLPMRAGGYLEVAPGTTTTAIPGVFAAGDVTDDVYRQAITAAGMGCMAALEAEKYLANLAIGETPRQAAAE
ncbi:Thioredoxin reductase [Methylobacterium crusticola]|uniref:Thioredoxin reductase n=1 Tax=Methylobacterium crusticola TaxID=1697972 RepID=A0ABQ4QQS7_9HYPH|nr:thioredoxin-disulfide reductase [Methylobacterium crusticola]GJD47640.1 Thioredoxin reductase [Methylobacterium crusticola]